MEHQDVVIVILSAVVAVSEAMALIPGLKDNGILQAVLRIGKKLLAKKKDVQAP